jgi:hypothetical protein
MAKNGKTGDGHLDGAVSNRSKVFNPHIEKWIKRNADNGQFMSVKSDGEKFKGVRKENKNG